MVIHTTHPISQPGITAFASINVCGWAGYATLHDGELKETSPTPATKWIILLMSEII